MHVNSFRDAGNFFKSNTLSCVTVCCIFSDDYCVTLYGYELVGTTIVVGVAEGGTTTVVAVVVAGGGF